MYQNTCIGHKTFTCMKKKEWDFRRDFFEANFRAIIKNPVVPIYFTNRALCYMQTLQWDKAVTDCKKALDLDRENAKVILL